MSTFEVVLAVEVGIIALCHLLGFIPRRPGPP
jgi:hypothetical protein